MARPQKLEDLLEQVKRSEAEIHFQDTNAFAVSCLGVILAFVIPVAMALVLFNREEVARGRPFWMIAIPAIGVALVSYRLALPLGRRVQASNRLLKDRYALEIARPVISFLRPEFTYDPKGVLEHHEFLESRLFDEELFSAPRYGSATRVESGHRVSGTLTGLRFAMHEASTIGHTRRTPSAGRARTIFVFKGFFVQMDLPFKVPGRLRIRSTAQDEARRPDMRGFHVVDIQQTRLNQGYEVDTTHLELAGRFLTADLSDLMNAQAETEFTCHLSLFENTASLAIDRPSAWFEARYNALVPMADVDELRRTFDFCEAIARELQRAAD